MKESKEMKFLGKTYRDYLNGEIRRPEVRQAKKEFIASCFQSEDIFFFRPAIVAPVVVLSIVAIAALLLSVPKPVVKSEQLKMASKVEEEVVKISEGVPGAILSEQAVEVKRLVSRVGTPMVYQKTNHGHPITIIWVFTRGHAL